ncbi:MAG: hypothetical protein ACOCZE_05185 [Planctomycetota bacterium]
MSNESPYGQEDLSGQTEGQEDKNSQIRQKHRKSLLIQLGVLTPLALLGMLPIILGDHSGNYPSTAFLVGIGIIGLVLIGSFVNWRCPSCRGYLGRSMPRHCPKCGVKLR